MTIIILFYVKGAGCDGGRGDGVVLEAITE